MDENVDTLEGGHASCGCRVPPFAQHRPCTSRWLCLPRGIDVVTFSGRGGPLSLQLTIAIIIGLPDTHPPSIFQDPVQHNTHALCHVASSGSSCLHIFARFLGTVGSRIGHRFSSAVVGPQEPRLDPAAFSLIPLQQQQRHQERTFKTTLLFFTPGTYQWISIHVVLVAINTRMFDSESTTRIS